MFTVNFYEFYEFMYVPFAGIDILLYLCEFLSVLGSQGWCKECTQELLENSEKLTQGVCKNPFSSFVRSVPCGHTRIIHQAQKEYCNQCTSESLNTLRESARSVPTLRVVYNFRGEA